MVYNTANGNRLHHPSQLEQCRSLLWRLAHASIDDDLEWLGDRPLDLPRNGHIGVDHALDALADVIYIGTGSPPGIQPAISRNLRRGPLAPPALEVADHQAATVLSKKTIVNAEVPVDDAKGVEAGQGVDNVENPAFVGFEGGEAR